MEQFITQENGNGAMSYGLIMLPFLPEKTPFPSLMEVVMFINSPKEIMF